MQKTILIFIFSLLILGTIEAQELSQEELVNQFSLTLLHSVKYNDKDTSESIYPSLQDIRGFLDINYINTFSEEDWKALEIERAEDLELYFADLAELRRDGIERSFDWEVASLKDVTFEVDTEIGEIELENDEVKEIRLDLFYLTIFISDGKQTLEINIDEAMVFDGKIKLVEISDWEFRLNED